MLVHEIIELNARKAPARTAISDDQGVSYTWAEFDRAAELMAAGLAGLGVVAGDRVGLFSKNSCAFYVAYIATNKVGASLAPINYRFSPSEIRDVIADSSPAVVLVAESELPVVRDLMDALPDVRWRSLERNVTGVDSIVRSPDAGAARPKMSVDDQAVSLMCYTGGSTGRPKGVRLTHANVLANAYNWAIHDEIRRDDVYLAAGALFHIGVAAPFAYWLAGARAVVMNFEPSRALALMEAEQVTKTVASGTIFKMLIDEQESHPRRLALRRINCGAAPVPLSLVARAQAALDCEVGQIYGQTEGCFTLTYLSPEEYRQGMSQDASSEQKRRTNSVGTAVPLTEVRIVDALSPRLEFLGSGSVGEIVARGPNVMKDYWAQPELTEQTLVDGWLRTGDLAEIDDAGYVYLRGRKKDMIITGGENVYAQEVELVLMEHTNIDEAVVIGVPNDHWGERVHAIVTATPGQVVDTEAVRDFCRTRLAGYKVPKYIEVRQSLPRLSSNKIAKSQLRAEYRGAGVAVEIGPS
jgi:long-chain acyl-CoA synthetase